MFNFNICNVIETKRGGFMDKIKLFLHHPATIFTLKTIFYFAVLLGLLWFYGFKNPEGAKFIYNEF